MPADLTPSFLTYKNYLRSFAALAGFHPAPADDHSVLTALAERIRQSASFAATRPGQYDLAGVRSSLVNAWGTELLLALGGVYATEDEFVRLTNNWAAVQLYYVLYHATQAIVQARSMPRPTSHSKTQRLYADLWVTRPLDLAPWSLGFDALGACNVPAGQVVDESVTPVSWPRNINAYWGYTVKALKTTREQATTEALRHRRRELQSERRSAWKAGEVARQATGKRSRTEPAFPLPQLDATEKLRVSGNVRCHTFMDFCYRLRIKTNYQDSRMFLEGPMDDHSSALVHHDLRRLAASTLLLYELHLRQVLGSSTLQSLVDDWLAGNQAAGALALRQRRDLIFT